MLVLLPPSETKRHGGDGPPLDVSGLSFPSLNRPRRAVIRALVTLARDEPRSLAVLGLSERQRADVAHNATLRRSGTLAALERYAGVLYDALDYPSLGPASRRRADESLIVASALFGLLRARDQVPAYRMSATTVLPGVGGLGPVWRPYVGPVLRSYDTLVVDLRSTGYAGLAAVPGAVTVRVLSELPDGTRRVISHHSKHAKGRLARALVSARTTPKDVAGVIRAARAGGLAAEQSAQTTVDLVTSAVQGRCS